MNGSTIIFYIPTTHAYITHAITYVQVHCVCVFSCDIILSYFTFVAHTFKFSSDNDLCEGKLPCIFA
jgi:hypothetical protein